MFVKGSRKNVITDIPISRSFQEERAVARARAHTRAKALRSVIDRTLKSNFWMHVFTI